MTRMMQDHHLLQLRASCSYLGHLLVGIAITSWRSTERPKVLFWKRSVSPSSPGVFLWCFGFVFGWVCFAFLREDTWLFALTYSPTCGNSWSKTKRFDDRQSLERARHELKKKMFRRPYKWFVVLPGGFRNRSEISYGQGSNLTNKLGAQLSARSWRPGPTPSWEGTLKRGLKGNLKVTLRSTPSLLPPTRSEASSPL